MVRKVLVWFAVIVTVEYSAEATEICLRPACSPVDGVVRLGDVAELRGTDTAQLRTLAGLELRPAPSNQAGSTIDRSEIRRLLYLHGVDVRQCSFSGESSTTIYPPGTVVQRRVAPHAPQAAGDSQRTVAAIEKYLAERVDTRIAWQVMPAGGPPAVPSAFHNFGSVRVLGGESPGTGRQQFELEFVSQLGEAYRTSWEVLVTERPQVAVATRSLRPGEVLTRDDYELQPLPPQSPSNHAVTSATHLPGMECLRAITAGERIQPSALRKPILVKRNKEVEVVVRAGSLEVRMFARALADAGMGDSVQLENPRSKESFAARVIGPGLAEPLKILGN